MGSTLLPRRPRPASATAQLNGAARGVAPPVARLAPHETAFERYAASRVDFGGAFWTPPDVDQEWLIEPVIARGRGHALYAPAKSGKSLLLLYLAACAATGRAVLDRPAAEPVRTVYLDHEMTTDDLRERLTDMGFGPDDDLSALEYQSLPSMPPLDTAEGGRDLLQLAQEFRADNVIIDTVTRTVTGEENSADTLRAFYRHTGGPLKAHGVAVVRADHAGKDIDRGMRGTSAKVDDVDLVWKLTPRDRGRFDLIATHRRMGWVPEMLHLDQTSDPLGYRIATDSWPAGTAATAALLDQLDVPLTCGKNKVRDALKAAGRTAPRHEVILAAQRWRRSEQGALDSIGGTP